MSDLLNSASLVMIPSGYKEDILYSEIPTDGSGDMAFTRASNGTRINSAGLVEDVPWNLAQQSEIFTDSYWNKVQTTITANTTTAPNGTLTADTFAGNGVNDGHYFRANAPINSGTAYTLSIYAKKNTNNFLQITYALGFGTNEYANFDLNNGVTGTIGSGATATITNVGDGWYRCTVTATATSSTTSIAIAYALITSATSARVETNTLSTSVFIWGAQLNIGSTAKPYFPTTDRLNVPRLTYQNGGGGCPSLLLEKQSTNFQTYSQDFTNVAWTKLGQGVGDTAVVTANYAISPDGTQNATRFVCNLNGGTTSSDRSWMIASFTAQATSTISIWIKLNSAGTKTVLLSDSGGGTKTISGTDWQRIDATFVGAGGEFRIGLIGGSTSDTLDCCIWGAQAESGSYPTSYIPTTSSSATRVADAYSRSLSSIISGTAYINITDNVALGSVGTHLYGPFSITGASLGLHLSRPNNQRLRLWTQASANVFQTTVTNLKLAITWDGTNVNVYQNGVKVVTNYSYALTNVNKLSSNTNLESSATIAQIVLFNSVLTDAECISLTS